MATHNEWQSMETAPKDMTIIVAYKGPHGEEYVYMAFHYNGEWVLSFQTQRIQPYAWMMPPEAP